MRTPRSRARDMSGTRRQPSRRGQVGPALAWSLLDSCSELCCGTGVLPAAPGRRSSLPCVPGLLRHPGISQPHFLSLSPLL